MLSVVVVHVLNGTGVSAGNMAIGKFIISYFMPLFFFISGFFAYKSFDKWTSKTFRRQIPQKIKALVICSLVFYAFRYYLLGADPFGWLHKGFMGYWFTIVLFDMFVVYYAVAFISRLVERDVVLPVMAILALAGPALIQAGLAKQGAFGNIIDSVNLLFFLQWFVMGLIIKRYQNKFYKYVSNGTVKAVLIVAYIIGLCGFEESLNPVLSKIISSMIVPYIGVLTITAMFLSFKKYFDNDSKIARALCFIGRRTLDIYMIHYFFLPSVPMLGHWLAPNAMVLLQLIYGLGIAVVITAVCLLLSSCIRTSPLLADWLFGVRQKSPVGIQ